MVQVYSATELYVVPVGVCNFAFRAYSDCPQSVITYYQSDDSTTWTGCLMFLTIIIHDTVCMLISCPHQHFITCTIVKIHSLNVQLQGCLCHLQFLEFTPLCYEQQKRFNISNSTLSALILAGDLETRWDWS